MSEKRQTEPDVLGVLRVLRERAGEGTGVEPLRIHEADHQSIIRRISSEVAALTGAERLRPRLDDLMGELARRVDTITPDVRFKEVGTVQHVGRGVVTLSGLTRSRTNELVTFPTGVRGMVVNLEQHTLDVILLGSSEGIQGGDLVTGTGARLRIPVGHSLLGRVIDPLAIPLDGRSTIEVTESWYMEREAPTIVDRAPVEEPLHTGWKMVDALIPIGRGQRELILGDRQTGKTTLAVDAILSQRDRTSQAGGAICFYVAIGQKKSSTLAVIETLRAHGAMAYTTVVVAGADDPPAMRYIAPFAACSMAEFFMLEGRDVLIIYDDLTKHAQAYRELSLLLKRPPGREAYPGDVFYLHSRLLERAAKLNEASGGGSLTALPIAETQRGDLSSYIPTNLISITDGQIILDTDLFNMGVKPAVDAGRSVSRVGGAAQTPAMRKYASNLRLELAQYDEVRRFARFGTDVDESTRQQIRRGERWQNLLTQPPHQPLTLGEMILMLRAASDGYLDDVPTQDVHTFERAFIAYFHGHHESALLHLDRTGVEDEEFDEVFTQAVEAFRAAWFGRQEE